MANEFDKPEVDTENTTPEEETKASPKVERLMKIFEALEPEEQTQAFDKISVVMLPEEGTPMDKLDSEGNPEWAPMTEGMPYAEDDATAQKFNAMQDKLQDF